MKQFVSYFAVIVASLCFTDAGLSQSDGYYEGLYITGFEMNSFRSCGSNVGWDLAAVGDAAAKIDELVEQYLSSRSGDLTDDSSAPFPPQKVHGTPFIYLEFWGELSDQGNFGHMGHLQRQILVRQLKTLRQATGDDIDRCSS